jgi:hypothetical protein
MARRTASSGSGAERYNQPVTTTTQHDQHHLENPAPELLDVHPRDRPRNDELLDLRGALEDVVAQARAASQSRFGLLMRNPLRLDLA